MSRRTKIIISVAAAVVVIIVIILLIWWFWPKGKVSIFPGVNGNSNVSAQLPPNASAAIPQPTPEQIEQIPTETMIKAIAMSFTERFGSFSSENNFSNLDDLNSLMTVRMKASADTYRVSQAAAFKASPLFYGITTKAVSAQIDSLDTNIGRASVTVSTQRQESKGNTINPKILYQRLKLEMVNGGDGWKVDSIEWQ